MFASDIGMNNIEEINIVHEGQNYGWMKREGLFENGIARPGGALNQLFPLAAEVLRTKTTDGFTYPVAMFDHTQGQAVTGGVCVRRRPRPARRPVRFLGLLPRASVVPPP